MEQQSQSDKFAAKLFLFPRQYKFIGTIITAIGVIGILFKKSNLGLSFASDVNRLDPMMPTLQVVLIVGLFTIAWTRFKLEDEATYLARFQSLAVAFVCGLAYIVGVVLLGMFQDKPVYQIHAPYVMIGMLLLNLLCLYFLRVIMKN